MTGGRLYRADQRLAGRMARHRVKHRDHLLRFLDDDVLDATNNRAQRDLRPAVITRKTGGCNRTQDGADSHAALASVIATLRKYGVDVHDYLVTLQRGTGPSITDIVMANAVPAAGR